MYSIFFLNIFMNFFLSLVCLFHFATFIDFRCVCIFFFRCCCHFPREKKRFPQEIRTYILEGKSGAVVFARSRLRSSKVQQSMQDDVGRCLPNEKSWKRCIMFVEMHTNDRYGSIWLWLICLFIIHGWLSVHIKYRNISFYFGVRSWSSSGSSSICTAHISGKRRRKEKKKKE